MGSSVYRVQVRFTGTFKSRQGPNEISLEYQSAPTLREVIEGALRFLQEQGRGVDEQYVVAALDSVVISRKAWETTTVRDGQGCALFPPLQGGSDIKANIS